LVPRPSLSVHPSQGVSLGDNVTLRCHLPQPAARVELYKEGYSGLQKQAHMDMVQDMAEFHLISVKKEDAVRYQCQYWVLEPPETLEKSEPVELVVTDPSYPPANISLIPKERVETGTNVTIQCGNQEYGGIIFLHKDGHSAPLQQQKPNEGGTATFTLFAVTPADSGTYRCSYRAGGSYHLSSCLGDNETLEVIARSAHPGDNRGPSLNPVAAVAGS
ncbi:LOW QUALITY PROTEIN: T-cell-interacting, activating receptor on myeloid cells protein 1-like, partial [Phasianus colchicus]|uniref:LOW QUALITY PROTEIN: T-cell-interacting, activating receptor on myeloid cells protein 1-like n=1 Tax=Phasianus colchicus TaxID=9054 RepID=UPI00129E2A2D